MVMTGKDKLSPGDRILYNRKMGQIMFKRHGEPLVLSSVGSSIISIGPNCNIDGLITLIYTLLHASNLIACVKEHLDDSVEIIIQK